MRDPTTDPAVSRRLAMARYVRAHNKSQAARHFGCCWRTIDAAVQRVEAYERSGDIRCLQNQPRGSPGRTPPDIEEAVLTIYHESFDPPRPHGRRYSAAKVARLLAKRYHYRLSRQTAWAILRRRGVWQEASAQKRAVQRFERSQPNELWQIDLIEREPTAIGEVYGVPILDDHSRYLVGLRFFLAKGAETTLLTAHQAMVQYGTPQQMLCDRGGQFIDATGAGLTHFQEVLQALGITLLVAPRAQTKGKEERINQFIERDLLDEIRWEVESLEDLNQRAERWRQAYNQQHLHETIRCRPADRYRPGVRVDRGFLRELFAREERRKVTREGAVRYHNRHFKVPEAYIGWNVWVANFFDEYIEIRTGHRVIGAFEL